MARALGDWRLKLKAAGAVLALIAVFCLGMWLTAPKFPVERNFIPVSLNGEPIINLKLPRLPSFRARQEGLFGMRGYGSDGCHSFSVSFKALPLGRLRWGGLYSDARPPCGPDDVFAAKYLGALRRATHWRTEKGTLILENGTNVLRFMLHPN